MITPSIQLSNTVSSTMIKNHFDNRIDGALITDEFLSSFFADITRICCCTVNSTPQDIEFVNQNRYYYERFILNNITQPITCITSGLDIIQRLYYSVCGDVVITEELKIKNEYKPDGFPYEILVDEISYTTSKGNRFFYHRNHGSGKIYGYYMLPMYAKNNRKLSDCELADFLCHLEDGMLEYLIDDWCRIHTQLRFKITYSDGGRNNTYDEHTIQSRIDRLRKFFS